MPTFKHDAGFFLDLKPLTLKDRNPFTRPQHLLPHGTDIKTSWTSCPRPASKPATKSGVKPATASPKQKTNMNRTMASDETVLSARGFTTREIKTGQSFYWILISALIFLVFSLIYTIADWIQPTGKFGDFEALSVGLEIMVVGAFLIGFFLLFVGITVLYQRGTNTLTEAIFSAEQMFRQTKATKWARIITAGLMISIIVVSAGIILAIVEGFNIHVSLSGSAGKIASDLAVLHIGEILLIIAVVYLVAILLVISIAWLWNRGTIYFQKRFFMKKEADA